MDPASRITTAMGATTTATTTTTNASNTNNTINTTATQEWLNSAQAQGFVAKSNHMSLVLESRINGWDKRLFAEDINLDFICILCNGVCRQAVGLNCDDAHIFCEECITEYLIRHPSCCPQCKQQQQQQQQQESSKIHISNLNNSNNNNNNMNTFVGSSEGTTHLLSNSSNGNNNNNNIVEGTTTTTTNDDIAKLSTTTNTNTIQPKQSLKMNQNFYVRKKVANLQVICPHSVAYRIKMRQENAKKENMDHRNNIEGYLMTKEEKYDNNNNNNHSHQHSHNNDYEPYPDHNDSEEEEEAEENNACEWQGKLSELEKHLKEECKYRYYKCPFNEVGCTFEHTQSKILTHSRQNYSHHMILLSNEIKTLKEQMRIQSDQLQALAIENNDLRTIVAMLAEDKSNNGFNWSFPTGKDNIGDSDTKDGFDVGMGFGGFNWKVNEWSKKNKTSSSPPDTNFAFSLENDNNYNYNNTGKDVFEWDDSVDQDHFNGKMESNTNDNIWDSRRKDFSSFFTDDYKPPSSFLAPSQSSKRDTSSFNKDGVNLQIPWNDKFQEQPTEKRQISLYFDNLKYWDEISQTWCLYSSEGEISLIKKSTHIEMSIVPLQGSEKRLHFYGQTQHGKGYTVEWLAIDTSLLRSYKFTKFSIQFPTSQVANRFETELKTIEHDQKNININTNTTTTTTTKPSQN